MTGFLAMWLILKIHCLQTFQYFRKKFRQTAIINFNYLFEPEFQNAFCKFFYVGHGKIKSYLRDGLNIQDKHVYRPNNIDLSF